jgi:hypothetical protein
MSARPAAIRTFGPMGNVSPKPSFLLFLLLIVPLLGHAAGTSTWERTAPALVRGVRLAGRLVLKVFVGVPPNQRRTCVDLASSAMTLGRETRAFSASRDVSSEVYGLSSSGPFVRLRTVIDASIADGQPCEAVLGLGPLSDIWSWWSSVTLSRRSLTLHGGDTSAAPIGYVTDGVGSNCSGLFSLTGHIADGDWRRVRLLSGGLRGAAVDRRRYSTYLRTGIDPTSCWDGATPDLRIALDECRKAFAVAPHDSDEATLEVGTAALAACSVALRRDQIALSCGGSADPPSPLAIAARALVCVAIASTLPAWFGLGSPRTVVLAVGALSVLTLGAAAWSAACGTLLLDCQSVWVLVGLGWCSARLMAKGVLSRRPRAGPLHNAALETAVVLSIWTCMRMGSGVDFSGSLADGTLVLALVFRLFLTTRGDPPLGVAEVLLLRFHSFVLSALWSWAIFLDLYVDASHILSRLAATLLTASVAITAAAVARTLRRTARTGRSITFQ